MAAARSTPRPVPRTRKHWTLEECDRIGQVVDLHGFELIDGELLEKVSMGFPHMRSGWLIQAWVEQVYGKDFVFGEPTVPIINPGKSTTNAPEPDIAILICPVLSLTDRPRSNQVRIAIEVSDSTLDYDLSIKRDLYARAGIPEYWVADVRAKRVIVHRDPAKGVYRSDEALSPEQMLSANGVSIQVAKLF